MEDSIINISALGNELRRLRLKAKLSQQDVAGKLGLHRNTISSYETGSDIPAMTFLRLCVVLNGNVAEILERIIEQP
jgi:transcriptional regulator with XRE-family HTH domain